MAALAFGFPRCLLDQLRTYALVLVGGMNSRVQQKRMDSAIPSYIDEPHQLIPVIGANIGEAACEYWFIAGAVFG